jgi:hypothetical protein
MKKNEKNAFIFAIQNEKKRKKNAFVLQFDKVYFLYCSCSFAFQRLFLKLEKVLLQRFKSSLKMEKN